MVRLVFRPYTQFRRAICTSAIKGKRPPAFPLIFPYPSIDHHLSGSNNIAKTQPWPLTLWNIDNLWLQTQKKLLCGRFYAELSTHFTTSSPIPCYTDTWNVSQLKSAALLLITTTRSVCVHKTNIGNNNDHPRCVRSIHSPLCHKVMYHLGWSTVPPIKNTPIHTAIRHVKYFGFQNCQIQNIESLHCTTVLDMHPRMHPFPAYYWTSDLTPYSCPCTTVLDMHPRMHPFPAWFFGVRHRNLAMLLITSHRRVFTREYVRLLGPCFKTGQLTKA